MTDINISALPQIVNATPDDVIIINDAMLLLLRLPGVVWQQYY